MIISINRITGSLLVALIALYGCQPAPSERQATAEPADLILYNGRIATVDAQFSVVTAMAIRDGRVLSTGSDNEVLANAGPETQRIDLAGHAVLPGFNDTHSHIVQLGLNLPVTMNLTEVSSIAEIQGIVAERVAQAQPGEWLFSEGGWWEFMLSDARLPTRHDLDAVSPENPVVLRGGHYFIVNSLALAALGYDRETPDPPGGEIWRDADGEPTGFLLRAASTPALAHFPTLNKTQQIEGIRRAMGQVNAWGMTSLREATGTPAQLALLREIYDAGDMTVRIDWAYDIDPNTPPDQLDEAFAALGKPGETWGDGMLRADGLAELYLDGAEESGLLRAPYLGRPDYFGLRLIEQPQLNTFMAAAARYGWRPGPHAVGDAAIDQLLEAYSYVDTQTPIRDRRWMIDHAILLQPDHYARVRELGLIVNAQPRHLFIIADKFREFWGDERAEQAYQLRDWLDAGLTVTLGADRPISYRAAPLMQVYIAVTRRTGWGDVIAPEQAITLEEAIRAITATPAYTSFEEDIKGSLEPGKYADFVVLSDDILSIPAAQIPAIQVLATVLAGRVVYGALP